MILAGAVPAGVEVDGVGQRQCGTDLCGLRELEVDGRLWKDRVVIVDVDDLHPDLYDLEVRHRVHGDVERHETLHQAGTNLFPVDAFRRAQNSAGLVEREQRPVTDTRPRQKPEPQPVQRRRRVLPVELVVTWFSSQLPVQLIVTWYAADQRFWRKFLDYQILQDEQLVNVLVEQNNQNAI